MEDIKLIVMIHIVVIAAAISSFGFFTVPVVEKPVTQYKCINQNDQIAVRASGASIIQRHTRYWKSEDPNCGKKSELTDVDNVYAFKDGSTAIRLGILIECNGLDENGISTRIFAKKGTKELEDLMNNEKFVCDPYKDSSAQN